MPPEGKFISALNLLSEVGDQLFANKCQRAGKLSTFWVYNKLGSSVYPFRSGQKHGVPFALKSERNGPFYCFISFPVRLMGKKCGGTRAISSSRMAWPSQVTWHRPDHLSRITQAYFMCLCFLGSLSASDKSKRTLGLNKQLITLCK